MPRNKKEQAPAAPINVQEHTNKAKDFISFAECGKLSVFRPESVNGGSQSWETTNNNVQKLCALLWVS